MTKHERYNSSEKGRARSARYEATKRVRKQTPRRQTQLILARLKYEAKQRSQP